jgi:hypothetical protein
VTSADAHPVFGRVRKGTPGPASRVYPLEKVGAAVVQGVARRSRVICVPGWVNVLRLVHGMVPSVVEKATSRSTARADRDILKDIDERGAEASSRLTGPGGAAAVSPPDPS